MPEEFDQGFIPKKEKGSGQYQQFYLEGIELLQELSSTQWTDFNEHDPGVTILENLSYTLTELSNKTEIPIIDLLTESKKKQLKSGDNGFFIPSDILTTNPISIEDFRKLFIDQISNVKNVWLHPQGGANQSASNTKHQNNLKGLYRVFVEMYRYASDPVDRLTEENKIKKQIAELFHAHRNLCEDLYSIQIYKPFLLDLTLSLTLDKDVNGEEVYANLFFNINEHLTPEVRFTSLWERQEDDENINTIFNGPRLENGFIKNSELKGSLVYIVPTDLIKIIAKVPGVVSVDKFEIAYMDESQDMKAFESIEVDQFPIPKKSSPSLVFPTTSDKIIFKNAGVNFQPDLGKVQKRLAYIQAMNYGSFKSVSQSFNLVEIPTGNSQHVDSYYSLREQFPLIYGIGKFGLQTGLPKRRYAQANQLKAYLMPFDQVMTNFLAQLSNIYKLYNVNDEEMNSYFYQELEDLPDLVQLIKENDLQEEKTAQQKWRSVFNKLNGQFDNDAIDRLNQVADNLLARFSEQFPTYALRKINEKCFGTNQTEELFDQNLLSWKRRLISNYGNLSYNRAKAFDYKQVVNLNDDSEVEDSNGNLIPGIIKKTAILLGINNYNIRSLSKVITNSGIKIYTKKRGWEDLGEKLDITIGKDELNLIAAEDIVIIDEKVENLQDAYYYVGNSSNILKDVLRNGAIKENYTIKQTDSNKKNKFYILLTKDNNNTSVVHVVDTKSEANKAIDVAVNYLTDLSDRSEGVYLIEHILLTPPYHSNSYGFTFSIPLEDHAGLEFEQIQLKSNGNRNADVHFLLKNLAQFKRNQFKVVTIGEKFVIQIFSDSSKQLAVSTKIYSDKQSADDDIKVLVDQLTCIDFEKVNSNVHYYAHYGKDKKVEETFFSYQMSFVLPSWPTRFQNPNFKAKFDHIVYEQAPAHLAFESFWIDLDEMKAFEDIFYNWIGLVTNNDLAEEQMNFAFEIISKILQYRSQS